MFSFRQIREKTIGSSSRFPCRRGGSASCFHSPVDRDREAWRWSAGCYAETTGQPRLSTAEIRKMTGKAAEIAAILLRLPLDRDFFQEIEDDLVESGELTTSTSLHVRDLLKRTPLLATQDALAGRLDDHADWYADQLVRHRDVPPPKAELLARQTVESLLTGWRDPLLTRTVASGRQVSEVGAPLRAMLAYLYGEVAKNCYLVHHPLKWIECVSRSQRGDRCFDIDPNVLPGKEALTSQLDWEKSTAGSQLMERWLERFAAQPFDFNAGLEDHALTDQPDWDLRTVGGTNFFRGLPLIDLIEAMLIRAFGAEAVAVRVNGAGQGDYFQVHVDCQLADAEEIKDFIRLAFYRRFGLSPVKDFVEPHPGGAAVGVKLDRFDQLPALIAQLRKHTH